MNASYGVYPSDNGQFFSADGGLYDTFEEAYNQNVAIGMIDDYNTPAQDTPNYSYGSEAAPTTVAQVINKASAPNAGTTPDGSWGFLSNFFSTTMSTAGSVLNTKLKGEVDLAQAKINAQIAAVNKPTVAPASPIAGGTLLLIGAAALIGLVVMTRGNSRA